MAADWTVLILEVVVCAAAKITLTTALGCDASFILFYYCCGQTTLLQLCHSACDADWPWVECHELLIHPWFIWTSCKTVTALVYFTPIGNSAHVLWNQRLGNVQNKYVGATFIEIKHHNHSCALWKHNVGVLWHKVLVGDHRKRNIVLLGCLTSGCSLSSLVFICVASVAGGLQQFLSGDLTNEVLCHFLTANSFSFCHQFTPTHPSDTHFLKLFNFLSL